MLSEEEFNLRKFSNSATKQSYLPPPEDIHITLDEVIYHRNRRYVFIGDIHGCLDELQELLDKLKANLQEDVIILIGDLINKGPKNVEVVQFARKNKFLSVRGNHDDYCLARLYDRRKEREIGRNPDENSLLLAYKWTEEFLPEDEEYLLKLPYTISIPQINVIAVHAGLIPHIPFSAQHPSGMYRMRNIVKYKTKEGEERYASSDEADIGEPCGSHWVGPSHVIFGHDAKRKLQFHKYALGLDTGCCYGGELSAAVFSITNNNDNSHCDELQSEVQNELLPANFSIYQVKARRQYEVPKFK